MVTAVITTHGRLSLLKKAVESVKKQTYGQIELIVVDDCSSDGTKEWAEQQSDFRYIYISKSESKGGNYARNIGIKAASGDLIAFLDDDDAWYPAKIEKQVALIRSNEELGFVYTGRYIVYEGGHKVPDMPMSERKGDISKDVFTYILCTTSTLMAKKDVVLAAGMFDEALQFWQETDLIIRMAQISKTDYVPEALVDYLQVASASDPQKLSAKLDQWIHAVEYINNKHKALISQLSDEQKRLRKLLIYGDAANRCLMANQMQRRRIYKKKIYDLDRTLPNFVAYVFGIDRQLLNMKFRFK